MSGGGDVRVLRQEAGQESPRMPAWKREILERRKAKGGVSAASPAPETSPGGAAGSHHVNGDETGNASGGGGGGAAAAKRDGGASGASGRNYTITTASQHFAHNKELRAAERTAPAESLVLQESLGPLEENPFIKLEKERRKRQDRENAARPMQHILELYGSVPGIRTIRAENIIIIESDPDYFPEAGEGRGWQQNGADACSSLDDLLDRRGSAVTEIRAREVVIYDTALSRSEENLSTLGRPDPDAQGGGAGGDGGQGRVSRILQKFDCNYGKLQKKSHSTENLLDLDCSASARPRHRSKPQPDLVPKPRPSPVASGQPTSPVFQTPWTPKPKPQPEQHHPGSPQPVSSFRQRFEGPHDPTAVPRDEPDRGQSKLTRERDWEGAEVPPRPKVPCSPETRHARAESSSLPVSSKVLRSSSEFEIRPSPKPDIQQIPDGDTQARALANLRLQSKNSFTVVPKRHLQASAASGSPGPPSPVKSSPSHRTAEAPWPGVPTPRSPAPQTPRSPAPQTPHHPAPQTPHHPAPQTPHHPASQPQTPHHPAPQTPHHPAPQTPHHPAPQSQTPHHPAPTQKKEKVQEIKEPEAPPVPPPACEPAAPSSPPALTPPSSSPPAPEQPAADKLPITNIDDIEVEPPRRAPVPSPMVQRKKGNTFTVVPKRSAEPQKSPAEPQQEAPSEAPEGPAAPALQPKYPQLGNRLKKRYPAVEEIEVIGGYLSLAKSCLSKSGSEGKKLKISFNESSLHSTYEYPSESSVWDSGEEDEEEKQEGTPAEEQPSMVGRFHIPRPSLIDSPVHTENGNDLSSYIPKHSVDFNAWQENKQEDKVYQKEAASPQLSEEVMLTPADSASLSDYSSEPALYF
uniref:Taperin n=1 Tax=Fundulus heteroclitus TaxID=8078 RepID=A0A3Q2UJV1_FUNHE